MLIFSSFDKVQMNILYFNNNIILDMNYENINQGFEF